jgi:hypothetical protein
MAPGGIPYCESRVKNKVVNSYGGCAKNVPDCDTDWNLKNEQNIMKNKLTKISTTLTTYNIKIINEKDVLNTVMVLFEGKSVEKSLVEERRTRTLLFMHIFFLSFLHKLVFSSSDFGE